VSEQRKLWTKSQLGAFPYIQQGVGLGMSATAALIEYRDGGGKIRNADWFSLFKQVFSYLGVRDNIKKIPMTYTVPDTMFEPVDYDFREQFVMQMKVRGYSKELGQYVTRWVTTESDKPITKREWTYGAERTMSDTVGSDPLINIQVLEWVPLQKSGVVRF